MNKLKKILFIVVGLISFLLGMIGVIVPVLPTTPFLILASFCFVRGSKKFDRWLKSTKVYKKHMESFVENKAMTLKQKICLLTFADVMIAFPLVILDSIHVKLFLISLILFKYYYFIFRIKTIKTTKKSLENINM